MVCQQIYSDAFTPLCRVCRNTWEITFGFNILWVGRKGRAAPFNLSGKLSTRSKIDNYFIGWKLQILDFSKSFVFREHKFASVLNQIWTLEGNQLIIAAVLIYMLTFSCHKLVLGDAKSAPSNANDLSMSNVLMNIDKTRSMSFDLDIIFTKHAAPKYDEAFCCLNVL